MRLRAFFNHPLFVEACAERLTEALARLPEPGASRLVFTAHSIPLSMAAGSPYVLRLRETCRLVAARVGADEWDLVWQSRSGPPSQPWLEPDIGDHVQALHERGVRSVLVAPIGFVSDHFEVVWDLDTELQERTHDLGLDVVRAATVGTHAAYRLHDRRARGGEDGRCAAPGGRPPASFRRPLPARLLSHAGSPREWHLSAL